MANNTTTVLERERLRQFRPRVTHNGTWHRPHTVTPTLTGERLRLTYLLYRGESPATPTVGNAYREVHLWVNVTAPSRNVPRRASAKRLTSRPTGVSVWHA
jgi:uncharacterized membrane protein